MGTNRTGTGRWKNLRAEVIQGAIEAGLVACPLCRTPLNYTHGRKPDSAEVDHIVPHAHGGSDERSNLRVICRRCNQRLGAKQGRPRVTTRGETTTTSIDW